MARTQSKIDRVTGTIASLRTILEDYPNLQTVTITPETALELLLEIARLFGLNYTELLNWVAKLLSGANYVSTKIVNGVLSNDDEDEKDKDNDKEGLLNAIEIAVKSVLLANFQGLFTCTINPFLPNSLMRYEDGRFIPNTDFGGNPQGGMALTVDGIDLFGHLQHMPTDKSGGDAFYFDTTRRFFDKNVSLTPSTLDQSFDFNAFLWFLMNKGIKPEGYVWDNRVRYMSKFRQNPKLLTKYRESASGNVTLNGETIKKKGILICDYHQGDPGVLNDEHFTFYIDADTYHNTRKIWGRKCNVYEKIADLPDNIKKGDAYKNGSQIVMFTSDGEKKDYLKIPTKTISSNGFYVNKTIFEFNYDFIYGLKLFDSKTLVAQVLNALTNIAFDLGLNVHYTIEQRTIAAKVRQMISDAIEMDDQEIDNSSYNFSNEDYDKLLEESILKHSGNVVTDNGDIEHTDNSVLYNYLNDIENASSYDEEVTAIKNAISGFTYNVVEAGSSSITGKWSLGMNKDIFKTIIEEIMVEIIMQILSPKVVVLYAINAYVMGGNMHEWKLPNWEELLNSWRNMLIACAKQIKDIILEELYKWLMERLKPLIQLFVEQLVLESVMYYKELITQLIQECAYIPKLSYGDTVIDNVNYADIIPTQNTPKQ